MQVSKIDLKCSKDVFGVNCSSLDIDRPENGGDEMDDKKGLHVCYERSVSWLVKVVLKLETGLEMASDVCW